MFAFASKPCRTYSEYRCCVLLLTSHVGVVLLKSRSYFIYKRSAYLNERDTYPIPFTNIVSTLIILTCKRNEISICVIRKTDSYYLEHEYLIIVFGLTTYITHAQWRQLFELIWKFGDFVSPVKLVLALSVTKWSSFRSIYNTNMEYFS